MITGNRDYDADDDLAGLVDGLEQLARHLDAQHYPGRAWPVSAARRPRSFAWQVVAPLAAVAAAAVMGAVLVHHSRAPQSPMVRAPGREETVRQSPEAKRGQSPFVRSTLRAVPANGDCPLFPRPPESPATHENLDSRIAIPPVVVVEDTDSYSFIDTTAGTPMVSFATKDSCSPLCVVPVLPASASQAAEAEKFDQYRGPPAEKGRAGGSKSGPRGDT
jgi:hypothetical protein